MFLAIELKQGSNNPRLDPSEVDAMFNLFYQIHDHTASYPAQPVWWERVKKCSDSGPN